MGTVNHLLQLVAPGRLMKRLVEFQLGLFGRARVDSIRADIAPREGHEFTLMIGIPSICLGNHGIEVVGERLSVIDSTVIFILINRADGQTGRQRYEITLE